ncbi:MAG: histidine--tRNA ligase, partial [Microbacteriaceae bacterium]|nr:histidine--tRNA ligase [Microbacteriaceae bacterium]
MAKEINPPRGMRDFLPAEKAKRERVLGVIRESFASFGFQEVETPALENLDRLTSGQGGDNEKLAYRVMKRGAELDSALENLSGSDSLADLGLRFDLTVPLTRFYATNRSSLPSVFKAIQMGPVWRAERPQKGRYRQFVQCDIDIIGDASVVAEVELITASLAALDSLGLGDAVIRVNHRTLLTELLTGFGVSESGLGKAMIIIDKLDKIEATGVVTELREEFGDEIANKAEKWLASVDTS